MDFRSRIDSAEEARHREVMDGMGVYEAQWALSKVAEQSDVQPGQNRLLLTKDTVRGGSIPKVFPELEQLREDGLNAEVKVPVMVLDGEGREYAVNLRYLNSNKAYRVMGPPWRLFVHASGMSKGDRLDLYTCRRAGDDERCLFAFITKGCDAWCTKARKRARQLAADAVRDLLAEDDQEFLPANNGGRAAGGGAVDDGRHRGDADYTRPKRDRGRDRRRAKNGSHVGREDHNNLFPTNDGVHAWASGFQEDYGFCKPERRREDDKASWYLDATPDEIEAAKGLLMLKYALLAQRRYY
ncbi:hypothetical protein ACQ4PT_048246 [Festuca glaucescens]